MKFPSEKKEYFFSSTSSVLYFWELNNSLGSQNTSWSIVYIRDFFYLKIYSPTEAKFSQHAPNPHQHSLHSLLVLLFCVLLLKWFFEMLRKNMMVWHTTILKKKTSILLLTSYKLKTPPLKFIIQQILIQVFALKTCLEWHFSARWSLCSSLFEIMARNYFMLSSGEATNKNIVSFFNHWSRNFV